MEEREGVAEEEEKADQALAVEEGKEEVQVRQVVSLLWKAICRLFQSFRLF